MRRLLFALIVLSAPAVAWAQNQLPAIQGPSGYQLAAPTVQIGYDSGTGAACVVGKTATCKLAVAATLTPSGTQDVNIKQVGGNAVTTTVPVSGAAAAGSAVSGNPVLVGGTDGTNARTVLVDSSGRLQTSVQGNVASGAADSGNPVKIGGVYNGTVPTVTTGQRVDWQMSNKGEGLASLSQNGNQANIVQGGDAGSNGSYSLLTSARASVFNGTSWDRVRDASSANATTGTGLRGAGVLGKYNSTFPTYTDGQFGNLQINSNGQLYTIISNGNVAAGVGNPGDATSNGASGLRTTGFSLVFNGTSWDRTRSIQGVLGDNTGLGVQATATAGAKFSNITTATTTTVKSGAGILHGITINTPVASATITLYDKTTATGTKIATITLPSTITSESPFRLMYDVSFATGLTIVTSGATDLTVSYR